MRQALDLFAQLKRYNWPDETCELWPKRMLDGECAITVKWSQVCISEIDNIMVRLLDVYMPTKPLIPEGVSGRCWEGGTIVELACPFFTPFIPLPIVHTIHTLMSHTDVPWH